MEVVQPLHTDSKVPAAALEQMASLSPVLGEEVEVVSRDIEGAGELWSPYTDECPVDVPEIELWLNRRGFGQRQTFEGGFHGASVDVVKVTIDAKGVEEIRGIPIPVADSPEFLKARCACDCLILIRCKLYNDGEGRSYVVDNLANDAIAAHLIDDPIQHNHLPVEIVEGANPEITIVQQEGAGDGPFVDPLYKRPRRRDLEECVEGNTKASRQRARHEIVDGFAILFRAFLQNLLK